MIFADILSVATGVGGCGWPIYTMTVRMDIYFWYFSNNPPNPASLGDVMRFLVILYFTCPGPFYWGIYVIDVVLLGFVSREIYLHAMLHASGSEMHDSSE